MGAGTFDSLQAEFANEAFYLAFEAKDFAAMAHLWSEKTEVTCLHPGWPLLRGREPVLASWREIVANPNQGQVSVYQAEVSRYAQDVFLVNCYERAGDAVMVASNWFVAEDERLRMISHQAGYCANPPPMSGEQ